MLSCHDLFLSVGCLFISLPHYEECLGATRIKIKVCLFRSQRTEHLHLIHAESRHSLYPRQMEKWEGLSLAASPGWANLERSPGCITLRRAMASSKAPLQIKGRKTSRAQILCVLFHAGVSHTLQGERGHRNGDTRGVKCWILEQGQTQPEHAQLFQEGTSRGFSLLSRVTYSHCLTPGENWLFTEDNCTWTGTIIFWFWTTFFPFLSLSLSKTLRCFEATASAMSSSPCQNPNYWHFDVAELIKHLNAALGFIYHFCSPL